VDESVQLILQIALDTPLRRAFDYLPPDGSRVGAAPAATPGVRVRVPFGRRQLVGILLGTGADSAVAAAKLKPALEILDERLCSTRPRSTYCAGRPSITTTPLAKSWRQRCR